MELRLSVAAAGAATLAEAAAAPPRRMGEATRADWGEAEAAAVARA
jgi:hypothetical protein